MFECIKFIFEIVVDFIKMLFSIDIGNNISLGLFMCILFIFFPTLLTIFNFFVNSDDLEFKEMLKKDKGSGKK